MKTYTQEEVNEICRLHTIWIESDGAAGQEANLKGANLKELNLREADLQGANLGEACLEGAILPMASLNGANLNWANLRESILSGANLLEAELIGADLAGADLAGADLEGADLTHTDLTNANFRRANLTGAILTSAKIEGADFTGAIMPEQDHRTPVCEEIATHSDFNPPPDSNAVESPTHYTHGNIECIDAIKAALTDEEYQGFLKGNIIKYVWRERLKEGATSLEKALWYLKRLTENDQ